MSDLESLIAALSTSERECLRNIARQHGMAVSSEFPKGCTADALRTLKSHGLITCDMSPWLPLEMHYRNYRITELGLACLNIEERKG